MLGSYARKHILCEDIGANNDVIDNYYGISDSRGMAIIGSVSVPI